MTSKSEKGTKSNKKWILVGALLLVIAVFSYRLIADTKTNSRRTQNSVPTNPKIHKTILKSSADENLTKNWKTYADKQHKYSFKYPETWIVKTTSTNEGNNVLLFDETNVQRIAFIGIPGTPDCTDNFVERDYDDDVYQSFIIGNLSLKNANICDEEKYAFSLYDTNDKLIDLRLDFINSSAEDTARQILKTIDNLVRIEMPL